MRMIALAAAAMFFAGSAYAGCNYDTAKMSKPQQVAEQTGGQSVPVKLPKKAKEG